VPYCAYCGEKTISAMKKSVLFLVILSCSSCIISGQNFWQQTNGPFGGTNINTICCAENGSIYTGTQGLGIYKSADQGNSWIKFDLAPAMAYTIVTNQSGDIFAGTSSGIYRSMDFGNTWNLLAGEISTLGIRSLMVNQEGDLFAGTELNGIYRSTDNGNNWINISLTIYGVQTLAKNSDGDIFAGTWENGIYRSTDNGDTWMPVDYGLTNIQVWDIAINDGDDVFAATRGGVFRTTDNGDHWSAVNNGLIGFINISIEIGTNGILYVGQHGNNGVFVSSDNGGNWSYSGLSNILPWALDVDPNGNVFAAGDIMHRSIDDGSNWTPVGLPLTTISNFACNQTGDIFAITGRLFRTHDKGDNWIELAPPPSGTPVSMAVDQNNDIWLGTDWGIYLSTDNGITWIDKELPQKIVNAVMIHSNGNIFLATQFNGILCSADDGNSWVEKNNGISSFDYFSTLAQNTDGDLFTGTAEDGIFRSLDTGNTWAEINVGLTNLTINSIAVKNQTVLFVATHGGGVFRSDDNGGTWTQVNNGLPNLFVRSLAVSHDGQIVAATFGGAFKSANDGGNWIPINDGLTSTHLNSIIIAPDGYVFTGGLTSGAFRSINSLSGFLENGWSNLTANIQDFPYDTIFNIYNDTIVAGFMDLSFISDNEGWIVTSNGNDNGGAVLHTTDGGETWEAFAINTNCIAIQMLNSTTGYAAGMSGTIWKTTDGGHTWNFHGTISTTCTDIEFPPQPADTGYACGMEGQVCMITPTGIVMLESNIVGAVQTLSFPETKDQGWFEGEGWGMIRHFIDGQWKGDQLNISGYHNSIDFVNNQNGWTVGDRILHTSDGYQWIEQTNHPALTGSLMDVNFINLNEGWAVGAPGLAMRTSDGGESWEEIDLGTDLFLTAVQFTSPNNGYIIGANKTIFKYAQASSICEKQEAEFNTFPNPTKGVVCCQLPAGNWQSASMELFTLNGLKVMDRKIPAGNKTFTFDISHLPTGIYFIRIYLENQMIVKKIIKL